MYVFFSFFFFFFKQKTAYEMRISDWSSDVCSSDLPVHENGVELQGAWLVGSLNLATTKTPYALYLNYCRIEKIEAIHSELAVLGLDGSCLQAGLDAGRLRCGGGVYLRGEIGRAHV